MLVAVPFRASCAVLVIVVVVLRRRGDLGLQVAWVLITTLSGRTSTEQFLLVYYKTPTVNIAFFLRVLVQSYAMVSCTVCAR